jgi:hypothetical protein
VLDELACLGNFLAKPLESSGLHANADYPINTPVLQNLQIPPSSIRGHEPSS